MGSGCIITLNFIVGPMHPDFNAFTEKTAVILELVKGEVKAAMFVFPELPIVKEG